MRIIFTNIFVISLLITSCSAVNQHNTIRIKGSDTMYQLNEALAREYMIMNPGISIYVEGGGTSTGVNSLIKGECDIAAASRTLKAEEAKGLAEYYSSVGMYYLIAKDALSVYVNENNPIKSFTLEELERIFSCEIINWKELGGGDYSIQTVIRPPNSGTHIYFREHILEEKDYCESAVVLPTTESIIDYINKNENAIGYGGIGYKEGITLAKVNGIEASTETARNDSYPITRYLHFFTSNTPSGLVKNFIDWVLSPNGQKIIKESGYITLWELPQKN